ncbi:lysylphosphatidylglycerol synthase transmembrane domain-containing protein [Rubrivirga sp. S365]|uniref:Lysylphosphatidylglycerol synthase transmembrane domain-containing protein n=1 Tax=Rubrivirga litoralis TaxID=3075598 RepID=A0ABU3BPI9_9BACT|nr:MULTISPECIES: lysylphosphatidylglycerol synthase transmembrane domain-containing protein [unclassified Rubrivirga]MDT0631195.1 lysylphosphatidylglycerol synthase transmembrane domain-containing protein [Rubrivirga sp. F394]MDT7856662.1 lysylphosphatidylglycerol synthase transmembrane domain-containing protein [Rubrivirga sp. S365]
MLPDTLDETARPPAQGDPVESGAADVPAAPSVSLRPFAWSVALSAVVFGVIGYATFDPVAFRPFLRDARPWLLVAAVGTVVLRVVFGAWRLRVVSDGQIGLRRGVRDQIVWDFFAYVTPSAVGGGPFLAVFMARDRQLPLGEATSVVLFAMLVDQVWFALTIPVLLVAAVWLDVFPQALGTAGTAALLAFFVGYLAWVAVLAYGTLVRPDRMAGWVERLFRLRWLRRFAKRARGAMADMQARSRSLRSRSGGFYAKAFAVSLVPWICRYALAVCVIASVYPGVDQALVFARSAALQLGALVVPTPGGAGGVEGLYVLFLGPPLVPAALVAPTLLVWRLLSFYVFIGAGLVLVARHLARVAPSPPRPAGART